MSQVFIEISNHVTCFKSDVFIMSPSCHIWHWCHISPTLHISLMLHLPPITYITNDTSSSCHMCHWCHIFLMPHMSLMSPLPHVTYVTDVTFPSCHICHCCHMSFSSMSLLPPPRARWFNKIFKKILFLLHYSASFSFTGTSPLGSDQNFFWGTKVWHICSNFG